MGPASLPTWRMTRAAIRRPFVAGVKFEAPRQTRTRPNAAGSDCAIFFRAEKKSDTEVFTDAEVFKNNSGPVVDSGSHRTTIGCLRRSQGRLSRRNRRDGLSPSQKETQRCES
jgi:hypothetical protein